MKAAIRHPWRTLRGRFSLAASLALVVLAVSATTALAYWAITYLGSGGSGSETSATSGGTAYTTNAITLTPTWPSGASGLTPGSSLPVTITATNNDASTAHYAYGVTATVTVDAAHSGCLASYYTVTLPSSLTNAPGTMVAAGGSSTVNGATIAMSNTATNQTACEGSVETITLSGSSS